MTDIKSLDYLKEIKNDNVLTNKDLAEILEKVGYILSDNGYQDARYFLDEITENIESGEIDL